MKNHVKVRTILAVAVIYLVLLGFALSGGVAVLILVLVYAAAAVVGANALLKADLAAATREAETFRKQSPMRGLGSSLTDFQHVFYHESNLLEEILNEINMRIAHLGFGSALHKKSYTDSDKNLVQSETREFFVSSGEASLRGTETSLVVHVRRHAQAQSVQWWILIRGFVDQNKKILLLASAPVAMPFWLWARSKQELDLATSVRNVYDAFYNSVDVVTDARSWHRLIFDALVDTLEKNGVDTSDLKQQRAQVMNINISGGKTRFGNVVQALSKAQVVQTGGAK